MGRRIKSGEFRGDLFWRFISSLWPAELRLPEQPTARVPHQLTRNVLPREGSYHILKQYGFRRVAVFFDDPFEFGKAHCAPICRSSCFIRANGGGDRVRLLGINGLYTGAGGALSQIRRRYRGCFFLDRVFDPDLLVSSNPVF